MLDISLIPQVFCSVSPCDLRPSFVQWQTLVYVICGNNNLAWSVLHLASMHDDLAWVLHDPCIIVTYVLFDFLIPHVQQAPQALGNEEIDHAQAP